MVKHIVSTTDSKIKQYEENFVKLKGDFQLHGTLWTGITVLRILDVVETLSEYFQMYGLSGSHAHLLVIQQKSLS